MFGKVLLLIFGSILIAIGTILAATDPYTNLWFIYIPLAVLSLVFFFIAISSGPIGMIIWFVLMGLIIGAMIFIAFASQSSRAIVSTILLLGGYILDIGGGIWIRTDYY